MGVVYSANGFHVGVSKRKKYNGMMMGENKVRSIATSGDNLPLHLNRKYRNLPI